ncbi:MAG: FHA domain-containing protein, partial [Acidobacteriota bacterium]
MRTPPVSAPAVSPAAPSAAPAGSQTPPVVTTVEPANQTASFNGPTGSLRSNPFNADSGQQPSMNASSPSNRETPTVRAKLIIQRGGKIGKEFSIVSTEAMIGRWDADGGIFPDVDLDQDDPEAKVSRRHARIQFLNNQYLIEDLGSTNGTFVNRGPRLLPGIKQP